ncbi:Gfo/Idh/MocA family protein [Parasediminibacterium sp. JCM 36343]|uniref:Gfo/Idh/MocA family protein n=1 Tax=Parasediminibacterium sp. JCM 36343 TaxID=3374279 RepID=UPI00397C459B
MKNYKWGILGAGKIADEFCTALSFTKNATVYAVASRNTVTGKAFAEKFKASIYYNNYFDLVNDNEVDIIYIATPHAFHYEHTMLCLQHKKHVLCEKPMSLSYQQTNEMLKLATENELFLMEGMWTTCMPFIQKIEEIIAAGIIGELQLVQADFGFSIPYSPESRLFNKTLGGGSIMDVGIYPIFLATLLLGEPSAIKSLSKLSKDGIDEYANMIIQYSNGATAHLFSAITVATPIVANVFGTKGTIYIQSPWYKATNFTVVKNDGNTQSFSIPHLCNGFEHEIQEVMCCLDKKLLQSPKMPHQLTLALSKLLEEILKQAGVVYGL